VTESTNNAVNTMSLYMQFWTHASRTPQEWLDALEAFKAQGFVRRIFLLGIPTARINPTHTAKGYPKVPADEPSYQLACSTMARMK
jgi:hypothetical protein